MCVFVLTFILLPGVPYLTFSEILFIINFSGLFLALFFSDIFLFKVTEMKKLLAGIAVSVVAGLASPAAQADDSCGRVTISDMNWNSATFFANVDKFILTEAFGCEAEMVAGDTMPTGTSMAERGEPMLAPEFWANNLKDLINEAVADKRIFIASKVFADGGEEGFWVPEYLVKEKPELKTIAGVIANKELFEHPEDPDVHAFTGCPAGWGCQISSTNLFHALKLEDEGFELVDPGSGAALAGSIAQAYERKKPWFGYYWAPTAVLGKYKMVKVDIGADVDEKHFEECISSIDCLEPKVTAFPPAPVYSLAVAGLEKEIGAEGMAYLKKRTLHNDEINTLLAWMEDNQADGEIAAIYFLKNKPESWANWLPADKAARVRKALEDY
jgi:glycine betaine/proline transport system substrate-binding protein